jgi:FtsP/CotA-like multicopper oxidase with cupredoxin domain
MNGIRLAAGALAFALSSVPAAAQKPPVPPKRPPVSDSGMAGMKMRADTGMAGMKMGADTGMAGMKMGADTGMAGMKMSTDTGMAGMAGMSMPIPMPKGMPMFGALQGLVPPITPFLPGAGVDPDTLPMAKPSQIVRLADGDTLDLTAMLLRREIGEHTYVMYGYNGQSPGPLIRVPQNATIVVRFHNRIDMPSTVHWHGLRLDNHYDGVPGVTQEPVAMGGEYTYKVHFPDAGVYWYHSHVSTYIQKAMGLFGDMLVDSPDPNYYAPANEEHALMFDDLLMQADTLIPFGKDTPDFALMGRVGNVLLTNSEPRYQLTVHRGAVVRFFLTNASSSRTYNLSFSGAPIKLLAGDISRFEHEAMVPSVVLGVAQRYVVEVQFTKPGRYALVNAVQALYHAQGEFGPQVDTLGVVTVDSVPVATSYAAAFDTLRTNTAVVRDIDHYRKYFAAPPDRKFTLTIRPGSLPLGTIQFMNVDTAYFQPVEWMDGMPVMNWLSTGKQLKWIIRDDATGKEDMDIDWHVKQGSVVKLRIFNDPFSFHPMQHPIHLHGQRMLVVDRDGVPTRNMSWEDTVIIPVGSTVDLLIDASNPGDWLMHCHIAEHIASGMELVLHVDPPSR